MELLGSVFGHTKLEVWKLPGNDGVLIISCNCFLYNSAFICGSLQQ